MKETFGLVGPKYRLSPHELDSVHTKYLKIWYPGQVSRHYVARHGSIGHWHWQIDGGLIVAEAWLMRGKSGDWWLRVRRPSTKDEGESK